MPKPKVITDSLKALTKSVRQHLQRISEVMNESDLGKREKSINRLIKMLELANDDAMLKGLGLSYAKVTQLKSANLKSRPRSEHTKETSPHHDLIRFAEQKACGTLPNYAAAATCVKWILEAGFDPLEVKDCWNDLEQTDRWRDRITIFTVKNEIGAWKMRRVNGASQQTPRTASERNVTNINASLERIRERTGQNNSQEPSGKVVTGTHS